MKIINKKRGIIISQSESIMVSLSGN